MRSFPIACDNARVQLLVNPLPWLVTGAAGFIEPHLVDRLPQQQVIELDNFATATREDQNQVLGALVLPQDSPLREASLFLR